MPSASCSSGFSPFYNTSYFSAIANKNSRYNRLFLRQSDFLLKIGMLTAKQSALTKAAMTREAI